ncbi:MAG TPA: hypothetical protein PKL78_08655 [Anaerolineales bacterium]|nr:hypothetical protein [Anaerolineales bacterium]
MIESMPEDGEPLISFILYVSILYSAGSLAWGYLSYAGNGAVVFWIVTFGIFWLAAAWKRWRWVSTIGIVLALPLAVIGLWLNIVAGWMFGGAIFALLAWDLTEFQRKMKFMPAREDIRGMERRHLMRISLVTLIGLGLASIFMLLRGQIDTEWSLYVLSVGLLEALQMFGWLGRPKV